MVLPAAKVKEGYNAVSLTLKDGTAVVGIPARETTVELFLRTATGQEMPVVKANILARENIGSIMPAGLTDQLRESERVDLYAFLAQLGKPGPYDASKGTVARYWSLAPAGAEPGAPPAPGYTLVDGRLTSAMAHDALAAVPGEPKEVTAIARFQLPAAGPSRLRLTGARNCLIDGKPVALNTAEARMKLEAGEHQVSVTLDPRKLPTELRLEVPEGRFLGN